MIFLSLENVLDFPPRQDYKGKLLPSSLLPQTHFIMKNLTHTAKLSFTVDTYEPTTWILSLTLW